MSSIQSGVVNILVRTFRGGLFTRTTEVSAHRKSFERISNLMKFPRNVRSEGVDIDGIPGMWFYPRKRADNKVILYFHGGAYCSGSVNTHKALIARLARAAECSALGIDYRLAPEHPFPAALVDALAAYRHLLETGIEHIYLAGDSAGGGLAVALMLKIREEGLPMPEAGILLSPWTDLLLRGESMDTKAHVDPLLHRKILRLYAEKYAVDEPLDHPLISPIYADLQGLPPILIQVGGREILLDDSTRLAKRLKKAGVAVSLEIWDEMIHVWQFMGGLIPEAGEAFRAIGKFIQHLDSAEREAENEERPQRSAKREKGKVS